MNCGRCDFPFSSSRLPRILPCGHSLCSVCLHSLLPRGSILCPDCSSTTISSQITDFRVNQALISVKINKEILCFPHKRPAEAFCRLDKSLLCVDCMLETHKGHEILALTAASKAEKEDLSLAVAKSEALEVKLTLMQTEIDRISDLKLKEYSTVIEDVETLFTAIQTAAKNREIALKDRFKQQLESCLDQNNQRKMAINRQLDAIKSLIEEQSSLEEATLGVILMEAKTREGLIAAALTPLEPFPRLKDFVFSRETELTGVFKGLRGLLNRSTGPKKSSLSPPGAMVRSGAGEKGNFTPKARSPTASTGTPQQLTPKYSRPMLGLHGHHGYKSPSPPTSPTHLIKVRLLPSPHSDLPRPSEPRQKAIFLFGGSTEASKSIDIFHPKSGLWTQSGSLRTPRTSFGSIVVGSKVVLFGGKIEGTKTAECECISPNVQVSNAVELRLLTARCGFACLRVGEEVYVAGGNEGLAVAKFEVYRQSSWKVLPNMRENREDCALAGLGKGQIMVIGGKGDTAVLRSCEIYINEDWMPAPSLQHPRKGHFVVSVTTRIYAFGGFDGNTYLSSFEMFNLERKEWEIRGNMPTNKAFFSGNLSEDSEKLWVFGGFSGKALSSIEQMSVSDERWEVVGQLPAARYGHGSAWLPLV